MIRIHRDPVWPFDRPSASIPGGSTNLPPWLLQALSAPSGCANVAHSGAVPNRNGTPVGSVKPVPCIEIAAPGQPDCGLLMHSVCRRGAAECDGPCVGRHAT